MTTVSLTDEQLELLRRETMTELAKDLRIFADDLDKLAILSPWETHFASDDLRNARSIVEETLGTLDALGWPDGQES